MVYSKYAIVKHSQHTTARFSRAVDDTASPSEQAAAGSCTEPTGKRALQNGSFCRELAVRARTIQRDVLCVHTGQ